MKGEIMKLNQTRSYQHVEAISATKIGQVVILLDHCVRLLGRAITAMKENRVEEKFTCLDQAVVILNTIDNNIDASSSKYAQGLSRFFQSMSLGVTEVNLANEPVMCEKIQTCLHEMAKIWRNADKAPESAISSAPMSAPVAQYSLSQESLQLSI